MVKCEIRCSVLRTLAGIEGTEGVYTAYLDIHSAKRMFYLDLLDISSGFFAILARDPSE